MKFSAIALAALFLFPSPGAADVVTVQGELKKWHKVTLRCEGPATTEIATPNPFADYRLTATFTHPASGASLTIPGYYAADGNAAETSASSGNVWHVHFAPDRLGTWNYSLSFRTGTGIAVDDIPTTGTSAGYCDGAAGTFEVLPTDKTGRDLRGMGRLDYVGKHHLKFAETGTFFMKCGLDSPENLLAYEDFDDTPNVDSRRKSWAPHQQHYDPADAAAYTWQGGKGSELLGAVRYLSNEGLNSFSFLTLSLDGDDDNVFPHLMDASQTWGTSEDNTRWAAIKVHRTRFDVSKLDQWERVFAYGTHRGMFLHFKTQETENDQLMDGGALGPERKLYYRELVARFGHHLALNWNLGEENSNSEAERKAFAQWFYDHDPYRHPVVLHTFENLQNNYNALLGNNSKLTGASLQIPDSAQNFAQVFQDSLTWVTKSATSGKPWIVACDEPGHSQHALRPDNDVGTSHEDARKNALWGNPLAGGAGIEWYFGSAHAHSDISCQDFASRSAFWPSCRHMLDFWKTSAAPFWDMTNGDSLSNNANGHCLYKAGEWYVIQLKAGGTTNLNLSAASGPFEVRWFDPRNGGLLQTGTVATVTGGSTVNVGDAPSNTALDWIVLVRKPLVVTIPAIQVEHPAATILPYGSASVDFATVVLGQPGTTRTITIRNTGNGSLALSPPVFVGSHTGFSLGSSPAASVAAGATTEFILNFAPTAVGSYAATLRIPSNAPNQSSFDLALTGTGAGIADIAIEAPPGTAVASGSTLNAGSVDVNDSPAVVEVKITNTGSAALNDLSAVLSDDTTEAFEIVTPPPATLAPGSSAIMELAFAPPATAGETNGLSSHAAVLTITSSDPDESPFTISLTGTGRHPDLQVTGNEIDLTGGTYLHDFGSAAAGDTRTFTMTVKNTGQSPLVGTVALAGDSSYSLAGSSGFTLAPDESHDFTVTFAPLSPGARISSVSIESSAGSAHVDFTGLGNSPPVAMNQIANCEEDSEAGAEIFLDASDPDGDGLHYEFVTAPQHGTVSGLPSPIQTSSTSPGHAVIYSPDENYHGQDSFTYRVWDGIEYSAPATVVITVSSLNDAPVASSQSITTGEDTASPVTLPGTDVDEDSLTYEIVTPPGHGTVELNGNTATYTPAANFHGEDSFIYRVGDGTEYSAPTAITITITPVNDPPVATTQSVTTDEDLASLIPLAGSDADEDTIIYEIVTPPQHGAVELDDNIATYTPGANFHGEDSFTYRVGDGTEYSAPVAITITVTPVNDPPVATAQSVTTNEDIALPVSLAVSDPDDDTVTYEIITPPTHGAVELDGNIAAYTPSANFHGEDSFTYRVGDGTEYSAPAAVTITVTPVNDPPVASSQSVTTDEDIALSITLAGSDVDEDTITNEFVTPPAHGTIELDGNTATYTPGANFHGEDSFTYRVGDGTEFSAPVAITITVTPVNDPPVATAQSVTTNEDIALQVTLAGSDADEDSLTYEIVTPPGHGTVELNGDTAIYTPAANFHGEDSFTYRVGDSTEYSAPVAVTITVSPVNDLPVATNQPVATDEDTASQITLTGSDADEDSLTYEVVAPPAHGAIELDGNLATYTPNANFHGEDSFTYRVGDGTEYSEPAAITITVASVNDLPVATSQSITTNEDIALPVSLAGSDADEDSLTYEIVTPPQHGTIELDDNIATYTPEANSHGEDSFTYRVGDGTVYSAPVAITIIVVPVNDPPLATGRSVTTAEDVTLPFVLNGSDADEDSLTYEIVTPPTHGAVELDGNLATYTPGANFHGEDFFTYRVGDGTGYSAPAALTITVTPVNDPPLATSQSTTTAEDTASQITLTGSDADGDSLIHEIVTPPMFGTVQLEGNIATYTPDANFHGGDSFTYRVGDGEDFSFSVIASITITSVNDAPETSFELLSTNEDQSLFTTLSKSVLKNDSDLHDGAPGENNTPLTALVVDSPPHAQSFTLYPDGTFQYVPRANFNGLDSFTYRAIDALGGQSEPETVFVAVRAVNDTPVAMDLTATTLEDVPTPIRLQASDIDALASPSSWGGLVPPSSGPAPNDNALILTVTVQPTHGTLSGTAPDLAYTPHPGFHGTDTFRYTASDGLATSAEATVTITIQPDNDSDSLPDSWEMAAFATLAWSGSDDPDGDGQDNAFELLAGHDPNDGNSRLTLELAGPSPDDGILRLNHVRPGVLYILEACDDLDAWEAITTATYQIEGPGAIYDPRSLESSKQFYRVSIAAE